jgi:hypothetical protein
MPLSERGPARVRSFPLAGLAALAAVLGGLLYVNALQNPFVYDDYHLILENESILNLQNLSGVVYQDLTRPLVNLSYAVDAAIWGRRPFGFHFTSVLLHMLNVGLVRTSHCSLRRTDVGRGSGSPGDSLRASSPWPLHSSSRHR